VALTLKIYAISIGSFNKIYPITPIFFKIMKIVIELKLVAKKLFEEIGVKTAITVVFESTYITVK